MTVEGGELGFGGSDRDQTAITSRTELRSAHPELKEILVVAGWTIDVVHVPFSGSDRMVDTQLHTLSSLRGHHLACAVDYYQLPHQCHMRSNRKLRQSQIQEIAEQRGLTRRAQPFDVCECCVTPTRQSHED